ncbi:hypothetical protein Fmac_010756 [Flemingia macrophylla]|uniref:NAC domain-containing protein n=1 Tax=Flemingia macrophylla TaxID=520843 RepID=A0ABD1MKI3_9FABA
MKRTRCPTHVGIGFRPTDEELVDFYLKHKLLCSDDPRVHVIPVIDLCHVEPWQVQDMLADSVIRFNDPEWFFFTPVDFKYSNSKRFNRTTECGFWKPTGKDRDIRTCDTNIVIGTKKTLVYYKGRVSHGVKSNWVIHEYHDATFHQSQRTFVLCRLIKKPEKTTDGGTDALIFDEGELSIGTVSDFENQATAEGILAFAPAFGEIYSDKPLDSWHVKHAKLILVYFIYILQGGGFTGMETISSATYQAEKCFFPTPQSPTGAELGEPYFANYPFNGTYFRNENLTQTPFKTTEEDEFLNSILVDDYSVISEESTQAKVNNFTESQSLKWVYCESSDTDTEIVSKLVKIYCPKTI